MRTDRGSDVRSLTAFWASGAVITTIAPTTTIATSPANPHARGDGAWRALAGGGVGPSGATGRRPRARRAAVAVKWAHVFSISRIEDSWASSSASLPWLTTVYVASCAFSSWVSCRASRSASARCPRAPARAYTDRLVGDHRDRRVVAALHARTRTAAAPPRRALAAAVSAPSCSARHATIRSPTCGHSSASSQCPVLVGGERRTWRGQPRSIAPSRSQLRAEPLDDTVAYLGGARRARVPPRSVDNVAAPRRSSAASAVDLPAPMPPVRPMNGGMTGRRG